ncbi:unnamed protein product, partial [Meganyctiphanes norvegica]
MRHRPQYQGPYVRHAPIEILIINQTWRGDTQHGLSHEKVVPSYPSRLARATRPVKGSCPPKQQVHAVAGDLNFPHRRRRTEKMIKSTYVAYFLWLIGGWASLHLLYLRRDRHAFVWWCTFGGYLGIGLLRDFVYIPNYVRDINEPRAYIEELTHKMKTKSKPPFRLVRFVGQILVGNSWSFLFAIAIPKEDFGGWLIYLVHLAPIGTALAVWTIGNIGRECGEFKWAGIGAFLVLPISFVHPPFLNWSSISSAILFQWKGKQWRRRPYERIPLCRRFLTLCVCVVLFSTLWASFLFFNASVTDKQGERIKLRDAAVHFLNSPMFQEFKKNLYRIYNDTREHGFGEAWTNFVELLDPHGETHALKLLGLEKGVSQEEITAIYRKMAREWHPDRHKGEAKEAAQEKFVEIQQAYETLSTKKNIRKHRNKRSEEVNDEL